MEQHFPTSIFQSFIKVWRITFWVLKEINIKLLGCTNHWRISGLAVLKKVPPPLKKQKVYTFFTFISNMSRFLGGFADSLNFLFLGTACLLLSKCDFLQLTLHCFELYGIVVRHTEQLTPQKTLISTPPYLTTDRTTTQQPVFPVPHTNWCICLFLLQFSSQIIPKLLSGSSAYYDFSFNWVKTLCINKIKKLPAAPRL